LASKSVGRVGAHHNDPEIIVIVDGGEGIVGFRIA
jgi:hypothetical protein